MNHVSNILRRKERFLQDIESIRYVSSNRLSALKDFITNYTYELYFSDKENVRFIEKALLCALRSNNPQAACLLLDNGADVGFAALHIQKKYKADLLTWACSKGLWQTVKLLLILQHRLHESHLRIVTLYNLDVALFKKVLADGYALYNAQSKEIGDIIKKAEEYHAAVLVYLNHNLHAHAGREEATLFQSIFTIKDINTIITHYLFPFELQLRLFDYVNEKTARLFPSLEDNRMAIFTF